MTFIISQAFITVCKKNSSHSLLYSGFEIDFGLHTRKAGVILPLVAKLCHKPHANLPLEAK